MTTCRSGFRAWVRIWLCVSTIWKTFGSVLGIDLKVHLFCLPMISVQLFNLILLVLETDKYVCVQSPHPQQAHTHYFLLKNEPPPHTPTGLWCFLCYIWSNKDSWHSNHVTDGERLSRSMRVKSSINAAWELRHTSFSLASQLVLKHDVALLRPCSHYSADSSYSLVTVGLVFT